MCIRDRSYDHRIIDGAEAARFSVHLSQSLGLSLIHISEPTRRRGISYAVFCLKKKKRKEKEEVRRGGGGGGGVFFFF